MTLRVLPLWRTAPFTTRRSPGLSLTASIANLLDRGRGLGDIRAGLHQAGGDGAVDIDEETERGLAGDDPLAVAHGGCRERAQAALQIGCQAVVGIAEIFKQGEPQLRIP